MLGLAFSGCAFRAAFHAGVAAALAEARLPIAKVAGASSGSVCAAAFAAGLGAALPDRWLDVSGRSILRPRHLLQNRSPFDMSRLLRTTLRRALGAGDLRGQPIEALVTATRLGDLSRGVFSSHVEPDFVEPVLASCFLPVIYGRAVRIRGSAWIDGGARDNLPVELLVERGCTEVIASVHRADGTVLKSLRRRRWRPTLAGARLSIIQPCRPIELGAWDPHPERMARAIDEGYRAGRSFLGT